MKILGVNISHHPSICIYENNNEMINNASLIGDVDKKKAS